MHFRHKFTYYREAIDCFCLRKSQRQKARVRLGVSSEQSERAVNIKKWGLILTSIVKMLIYIATQDFRRRGRGTDTEVVIDNVMTHFVGQYALMQITNIEENGSGFE